ncbi:MAG: hypothetical protein IID45_15350 [Planctomycetes bacterium]|nr:hypothetical protein [Planctomycetota bacterium]
MAICYDDGEIDLWDFANRKLLRTIAAHTGKAKYIYTIALSRDGSLVASGGLDNTFRIWDFETGALRKGGTDAAAVLVAAFTPDGKTLAFGNNGNHVKMWTVETGRFTAVKKHPQAIRAIAVDPFGKILATASADNTVRLFAIPSGRLLRNLNTSAKNVKCLDYSDNGRILAAAGDGKAIYIWVFNTK